MHPMAWRFWAAAVLSAVLLELPFPLAGPLPPARGVIAWFAFVPLLWAVLRLAFEDRQPLRRSFLVAYLCGILWYAGNCYWIYDTMLLHGDLPPVASALLLLGFSVVLGLYFGLFGLGLAFVARRLGLTRALVAAPFFWVALDLAAARVTSVPWDQLGYSQVDNSFLTSVAPWAGVYGITFLLMAGNALLAGSQVRGKRNVASALGGLVLIGISLGGILHSPPKLSTSAEAVLVQPNLDVTQEDANVWDAPQVWSAHISQFRQLANEQCKTYIAGIPQTGAPDGEVVCPPYATHPDLVVWPEAPAFSFLESDPRFRQTMSDMARTEKTPYIVGGVGVDFSSAANQYRDFNSAMLFAADGSRIGRYDKIHLVPFGEYIPFKDLLTFAHKLTGKVSDFSRGADRAVFRIVDQHGQAHRYGVFICYEAVFADEVRQFARNGAEVLVNISDDGWYGDTSAPWQHLNMARMRAIENRRWILRDTNNGVTSAIDPNGRVRQSIPRHAVDALPAQYGFRDDATFYTEHGDVFAWVCAVCAAGAIVWAWNKRVGKSAS
ncbi:apolipoprotein N-acyltransferase [Acidobacteria bacterium AB60]|nr:apolipoprotein N-acyltransferase [Acidobacteria bacterium AB60]